jgi:hypothetical protein
MSGKSGARRGNILRRYEVVNLLFFLTLILALGVFVSLVFKSYSTGEPPPEAFADGPGILAEIITPEDDSCVFYLGTKITEISRGYRSQLDIPVTDDGLLKGLFSIPGVIDVVINQRSIVIQKSPSANWWTIQSGAREVINQHLHMH